MITETLGRNILATELLKDGYHERAERVAAGNECMSDEPAVRACVEAVGEAGTIPLDATAREMLAAEYRREGLPSLAAIIEGGDLELIWPALRAALRAIEAALALPSPVRQGEDGEDMGVARSSADRSAALRAEPQDASQAKPAAANAFERIVDFFPGYDKTGETPDYGRSSMRIRFVLKGPAGATVFMIGTTWGPRSSDASTMRLIQGGAFDPCRPQGWDVGFHSPVPLYEGQIESECELLPSGRCYYDGSGLRADDWIDDFVTGGSDWVWQKLEAYYHELFIASVDRSGEADETALAGSAEGESAVGLQAETPDPDFTGHIDCPEDEGGRG